MNDYAIFVPVVNRFDLLDEAVASTGDYPITIIDNSDGALGKRYDDPRIEIYVPPVPLHFTQTHNLEFKMAKEKGAKYLVHLHSDAKFPPEKILDIVEKARQADADGRKWLVGFTLYEILAIYNIESALALGGYDWLICNFYFADNLLWRKAKLLGYERLEFGGQDVLHNGGGSVTLNNNDKWKVRNGYTFPLAQILYRQVWGGDPDRETYEFPFNQPDAFDDHIP